MAHGRHLASPIHWLGGKGKMVTKLLDFFPEHHTYAEPFGGGASMLIAKQPSPVEVYNDMNSGLVNFFRVLRDPERFERLKFLCDLTPYSREEYAWCNENWEKETDDVQRAYMWYIVCRMSFGGKFGAAWGTAVGSSNNGMASTTASWLSTLNKLPEIHKRLMEVQIENVSYERIFERYDSPKSLFYCDPPYVPETRKAGEYKHEMTYEDHEKLVNILLNIQGMAVLSGYPSSVYDPLIAAGWETKTFDVVCSVVGRTARNGLKGTGSAVNSEAQKRTEIIYISPSALEVHRESLLVGVEWS